MYPTPSSSSALSRRKPLQHIENINNNYDCRLSNSKEYNENKKEKVLRPKRFFPQDENDEELSGSENDKQYEYKDISINSGTQAQKKSYEKRKPNFNFQDFHYQTGRYRSPSNASSPWSHNTSGSSVNLSTSIDLQKKINSMANDQSYDNENFMDIDSVVYNDHNCSMVVDQYRESSKPIPYASICAHALVQNSNVIGISNKYMKSKSSSSSETIMEHEIEDRTNVNLESKFQSPQSSSQSPSSIAPSLLQPLSSDWSSIWKTSLDPHSVCRITSTQDGMIVAVSTGGGFISLLNGQNGHVLATRQVAGEETLLLPTEVLFVTKHKVPKSDYDVHQYSKISNNEDELIIFTPPIPFQLVPNSSSTSFSSSPFTPTHHHHYQQAVLVTGINGNQLTSSNPSTVANAARKLEVKNLQFMEENTSPNTPQNTNVNPKDEDPELNVTKSQIKISALNGCLMKGKRKIIRFLVCDMIGRLNAYDYDIQTNETKILRSNIPLGKQLGSNSQNNADKSRKINLEKAKLHLKPTKENKTEWICLPELGIKIDTNCSYGNIFIVAACNEVQGKTKICWYSVDSLNFLCEYYISAKPATFPVPHLSEFYNTIEKDPPVLLALEPVTASSPESAVAVSLAVRLKSSGVAVHLHVIQLLVHSKSTYKSDNSVQGSDEKNETTNFFLSKPHLIYDISHEPSQTKDLLQQIDLFANPDQPYSFKYSVVNESFTYDLKSFNTDLTSHAVGSFRLLLAKGKFDEADAHIIATTKKEPKIYNYAFETVHSSEVALWQLLNFLENNVGISSSYESKNMVKDCLRRLASGAVSGGDIGVQYLMDSSKLVSSWAGFSSGGIRSLNSDWKEFERDDYSKDSDCANGPKIQELRAALSGMKTTITGVLTAIPSTFSYILTEEIKKIDEHLHALKIMEEALTLDVDEDIIPSNLLLTCPLASVVSPKELYRTLISIGALAVAERVRRSSLKLNISHEFVASCVTEIPFTLDPRIYAGWLIDTITRLSLNHPLCKQIQRWVCQTADVYDVENSAENEVDGLCSSLVLLEATCISLGKLSSNIHKSFAKCSPFLEQNSAENHLSINLSETSTPNSLSENSNVICSPLSSVPDVHNDDKKLFQKQKLKYSNPSILQISSQEESKNDEKTESAGKPSLSISIPSQPVFSPHTLTTASHNTFKQYSENEEILDCKTKFEQAKILYHARSLGLPKQSALLGNYVDLGGASYLAHELVRYFMESNSLTRCDGSNRIVKIMNNVKPFCKNSNISFDDVVAKYTAELCNSTKKISSNNILDASSLATCCADLQLKCRIVLQILRAGLLCESIPSSLIDLSQETITEVSEFEDFSYNGIKSELEEATRLLMIDSIVRRYCGNGAQDFFHVSDQRHATKLAKHITRFVDYPKSLDDVIFLCDSYMHISKVDMCVMFLQNILFAPEPKQSCENENVSRKKLKKTLCLLRADQSSSILRKLYNEDKELATEVGSQGVIFCSQILSDCSNSNSSEYFQRNAIQASSIACAMLKVIDEHTSAQDLPNSNAALYTRLGTKTCTELQHQFSCILSLQKTFSVFLTLSDLRNEDKKKAILIELLEPVVAIVRGINEFNSEVKDEDLRQSLAHARRGCALLYGHSNDRNSHWFDAVASLACIHDDSCLHLISASGMLDDCNSKASTDALLKIAKALCEKLSNDVYNSARVLRYHSSNIRHENDLLSSAMMCILRVSSLLRENALINCPDNSLSSIVDLSDMIEILCQVLDRADGDHGDKIDQYRHSLEKATRNRREPHQHSEYEIGKHDFQMQKSHSPILHPTFYVGDGLLLPPLEALCYCMSHYARHFEFFNLLGQNNNSNLDDVELTNVLPSDIFSFLSSKGAWSVSLTILVRSEILFACDYFPQSKIHNKAWSKNPLIIFDETIQCLAERCLGGSNSGMINGTVDSQLAVSHLLSLPIKQAFQVFRSALPSPINKRDFARVVTLSNIGMRTGKEGASGKGRKSWKNQQQFVVQCKNLSSNACWWNILKANGVIFDPRGFGEDLGSAISLKSKSERDYAASLVSSLIHGSSKKLKDAQRILELAIEFGTAFSLDPTIAPQKQIEFFLSPLPEKEIQAEKTRFEGERNKKNSQSMFHSQGDDIRKDINLCITAAKKALLLLPTSMARSAVLRRCVLLMESDCQSYKDYERHSSILSLYYNEITKVLMENQGAKQSHINAFVAEIGRIENRQAALVILMSYFPEKSKRPDYPSLFLPFPNPFGSDRAKVNPRICGVLPSSARLKDASAVEFDPLNALHVFFEEDDGASTATALAPLCHSLGLPAGYIHARSLYVQLLNSKKNHRPTPSFECSVLPVIEKLLDASDAADFAEWCSMQYEKESNERLKCLDCARSLALQASCEAENALRNANENDDGTLSQNEHDALGRVKRIETAHSYLADKLKVKEIFVKRVKMVPLQVQKIITNILPKVQVTICNDECIAPEIFVECLLSEASNMTAIASLNASIGFTMEDFRFVVLILCEACKAVAERHSHVNVNECARSLARRWMVHGDDKYSALSDLSEMHKKEIRSNEENLNVTKEFVNNINIHTNPNALDEDEDTMDFVMDLNSTGGGWFDDVGTDNQFHLIENITVREEPDALKSFGSPREHSDHSMARTALRIAFVISVQNGRFSFNSDDQEEEIISERHHYLSQSSLKSSIFSNKLDSLQSQKQTNFTPREILEQLAKELLSVAFAKNNNAHHSENSYSYSHTNSDLEVDTSIMTTNKSSYLSKRESLTFAMRYRILRAVSLLCPQEIIGKVVNEENFLLSPLRNMVSLKEISFGLFIAMEIEAMGLPLPHSDLIQLSTMNFSSYARTLWRHHGRSKCQGFKGRILLLLLELCLKDGEVGDGPLTVLILEEISFYDLPRTQLSACELIASVKDEHMETLWSNQNGKGKEVVTSLVTKTVRLYLQEFQEHSLVDLDLGEFDSVLARLKYLVTGIGTKVLGTQSEILFIEMLCKLGSSKMKSDKFCSKLLDVVCDIACLLNEGTFRQSAFIKILNVDGGYEALQKRCGINSVDHELHRYSCIRSTSNAVCRIETSIRIDLNEAFEAVKSKNMATID